jgi:periplasmic protein TonB
VTSRALAVREGVAPVRDRLLVTFFFAAIAHAVLILGLTFSAAADKSISPPGLQVLLVSDELPESAKNDTATYLAQRTQRGSGNTTEHVAPRNQATAMPIPEQAGAENGALSPAQAAAPDAAAERVLTSTGWNSQVRYFSEDPGAETAQQEPIRLDGRRADEAGPDDDTGPAQLEGPKRDELWVTPDSRAASLAPYLDAWRHKVERIGTLNYPSAARRSGKAASPVLEVAINASGTLEKAVIRQSSGDPELDQASLDILKLASPFDPFPPELERQYRVLRFAYEWQFVGGRVQAGGVSAVP